MLRRSFKAVDDIEMLTNYYNHFKYNENRMSNLHEMGERKKIKAINSKHIKSKCKKNKRGKMMHKCHK